MMERRIYGRTGVELSRMAVGGHEYLPDGRSRGFNENMSLAVTAGYIGKGYGGKNRLAVLGAAYDLGINFFDVTIDSEKEALGRNFGEMPPPYEVYVQTRPEGMCYSYDKNNRKMLDLKLLRDEVQRGLRLLRRAQVDFFNIGLLSWSIENDPEYLDTLAYNLSALKREGLIRFAVADSFSGERLYLAMMESGAFDAVNTDLSFADSAAKDRVIPRARELGLGVIAREVFFKSELFRLGEEAGIQDRSLLARAALKWVLRQDPDIVLVGVDQADHLMMNAEVIERPEIEEEEAAVIERLWSLPRFREFESKKRQEFGRLDFR